jgi:hypothetical protein
MVELIGYPTLHLVRGLKILKTSWWGFKWEDNNEGNRFEMTRFKINLKSFFHLFISKLVLVENFKLCTYKQILNRNDFNLCTLLRFQRQPTLFGISRENKIKSTFYDVSRKFIFDARNLIHPVFKNQRKQTFWKNYFYFRSI